MSSGDAVLRVRRDRNYKTINLEGVNDPRLSWKATGILTYLLTRPDGWKFNQAHLTDQKPDGKASLKAGLKELQEAGYLRIERVRAGHGTFAGWLWTVAEIQLPPKADNQLSAEPPKAEKPKVGSSDFGESGHVVKSRSGSRQQEGRKPQFGSTSVEPAAPAAPPAVEKQNGRGKPAGPQRVDSLMGELAGVRVDPPDADIHARRTALVRDVQRYAWQGPDPPPLEGEDPEATRRHEMRILGDLCRAWQDRDIRAALAGARSHLGPGTPFSLRLLVAETPDGWPLLRIFADRTYKHDSTPLPGQVIRAIRAALMAA